MYQSERPDLVAGAETLALCRKMCTFLVEVHIEQQRRLCALSDELYFKMLQRANRLHRQLKLLPPAIPPPSLRQFEKEWGPGAEQINSFLTVSFKSSYIDNDIEISYCI